MNTLCSNAPVVRARRRGAGRVGMLVLIVAVSALVATLILWLDRRARPTAAPAGPDARTAAEPSGPPFRILLVPERDIFAQRRRFEPLAHTLSRRLDRPVELVTANTYVAVLDDFRERQVEAAFLGSLVAVLTMDRQDAQVIVKPESLDGGSTYRGVLFVPSDSPVRQVGDLAGRSIAMVKTTTAGDLFPMYILGQAGLLEGYAWIPPGAAPGEGETARPGGAAGDGASGADRRPRVHWVGTHDQVVAEVAAGRVDAGAAKDLRLDACLRDRPGWQVRRLAVSSSVPGNGLILRADVAADLGPRLRGILLSLDQDAEGRQALRAMEAARFLPCEKMEYQPVCDMIQQLGENWKLLNIEGPPPRPISSDCVDGPVQDPGRVPEESETTDEHQ